MTTRTHSVAAPRVAPANVARRNAGSVTAPFTRSSNSSRVGFFCMEAFYARRSSGWSARSASGASRLKMRRVNTPCDLARVAPLAERADHPEGSELGVARRSRERDHVADVRHPAEKQ